MEIYGNLETATLGGGCFWCIEAVMRTLPAVERIRSGMSGGVHTNKGQAEVVQVEFDNSKMSYLNILKAFFTAHDPTQINRQGADVGEEYRTIILYHSEEQKKTAEVLISYLTENKVFPAKIQTEVEKYDSFREASEGHQNYFEKNKGNSHCNVVIQPKIDKFLKNFKPEQWAVNDA